MWVNSGTITVQSGSRYVDGQGTQFVGPVVAGYALLTSDLRLYEIEAVESATRLRLVRPYQGGGAANVPYDVVPVSADVTGLIERIQALIDRYQTFRDTVGQGMFGDGSTAAPGMRFIADQDTGVARLGDNILALVAGGVARLTADLNGATVRGAYCNVIGDEFPQHIVSRSGVGSWRMGGLAAGANSWALQFNTSPLVTVDISGNFLVGVTSGGSHTIARGTAAGDLILNVSGLTQGSTQFFAGGGAGPSGAAAVMKAGTNPTTGRSIATGGTINGSGADSAEYMVKAAGCGIIAKGDVCGVDRDGKLTKTWADAISFVVKSTDPHLVGGDIWAAHLPPKPEDPGAEPQPPTLPAVPAEGADDAEVAAYQDSLAAYPALVAQYRIDHDAWAAATAAYARDLPAWEADFEAARVCVDRIAFSGQVPCNVSGDFEVGDYIVAAASGAGIKAVAVKADAITLPQYMGRIGKVWAIRDGRAWIDVQHG